jgi:hypothetical protein
VINRMDIRNHLVEDKHYALVPVPVIEMLARAGLSGTQMSIYMLHWSAGHISGDWKSTIAVSVLVDRLCVSRATVQRAYRGLVKKGMIRRALGEVGSYDIPEVEVLIPDELKDALTGAPSRRKTRQAATQNVTPIQSTVQVAAAKMPETQIDDPEPFTQRYKEQQQRLHTVECEHTPEPRMDRLKSSSQDALEKFKAMWASGDLLAFRKIHPKYAYKVRSAISEIAPRELVVDLWHQVMYSIERGNLSGRNVPHAFNTAMWLLRRGAWTKPITMPGDWRWSYTPSRTATCQM